MLLLLSIAAIGQPIKLNETNPHYFTYKDKPLVIVTSGEHYGAVLNLDFDWATYLNTLYANRLNGTRLCSGANPEFEGWYNIAQNTWAPTSMRYSCPWARSSTPGYHNGGNKFDLTKFNESHFDRLKDFMQLSLERDVIVELFLFTNVYTDQLWQYNPMKYSNNINGVGNVNYYDVYDVDKDLLEIQKAFVRKMVIELNEFDNLIWEISNEPYINNHISSEWEDIMIQVIVDTEATLPKKHLISQNYNNYSKTIYNPNPHTSIFNLHYARDRSAYLLNYDLDKVMGCNETGFSQNNTQYRQELYIALTAGAGLWNNLDYSFTVGDETGQYLPSGNPAGGNPTLRNQIQIGKEFIEGFNYIDMKPDNSPIVSLSSGVEYFGLMEYGEQYGIFFRGYGTWVQLQIPANDYLVEWIDTKTGNITESDITHAGGKLTLYPPYYTEDISLRITSNVEEIDNIPPSIPENVKNN